jgi:hypothetical protein
MIQRTHDKIIFTLRGNKLVSRVISIPAGSAKIIGK